MAKAQAKAPIPEDGGVQALTLRLPADEYQALRTYAFVTRKKINEVVRHAILDYLGGKGRREEMDAIIDQIRTSRRVALDKLAGM